MVYLPHSSLLDAVTESSVVPELASGQSHVVVLPWSNVKRVGGVPSSHDGAGRIIEVHLKTDPSSDCKHIQCLCFLEI